METHEPKAAKLPDQADVTTKLTGHEVATLVKELELAGIDSSHPDRLEQAVARAFEFLGFEVDQIGGSGDTDVLVQANIGPESYSLVVDAKARGSGKVQDLNVLALNDHREKNNADFAVVVAANFAGGNLVSYAKNNQVVLLSIPTVKSWLCLHTRTPLNLSHYRAMFTTSGIVESLPTTLTTAAEKQENYGRLLVDLLELIQETYEHGLHQPLSSSHLFTMLVARLKGVRYAQQAVDEAIALLTNPIILAALGDAETGISLAMNRATLGRVLRALADQIETAEAETQEQ